MVTEIEFADGQRPAMDQVRQYFEYLFEAEESGDPFPVDFDTVWPIAYATKANAKRALVEKGEFFKDVDYLFIISDEKSGGRPREQIRLSISCFEFFIARKSRPVFDLYRECRKAVSEAAKSRSRTYSTLPYHIRRYLANQDQVPIGYFSILQEVIMKLVAPLEMQGHTIKDNMLPDGSVGKSFCRALREAGHDPDSFPTYAHHYEDGRIVYPKLYPIKLLPDFLEHFQKEWMVKKAVPYFEKRDEEALPHLPRIIEGPKRRPELDA